MSTVLRKKMHQDLQLAGLSEGTQGLYLRVLRQLAVHYDTPPDRLSEQQVRDYLLHLKNDKKSASSTLGIAYTPSNSSTPTPCPATGPLCRESAFRRRNACPTCSPSMRCDNSSCRPQTPLQGLFPNGLLTGPAAERRSPLTGSRH